MHVHVCMRQEVLMLFYCLYLTDICHETTKLHTTDDLDSRSPVGVAGWLPEEGESPRVL